MTENKHLVPVEKMDVAVLFSEQLDEVLAKIEIEAMAHVPDTTTEQGRKDIASMAYKVTRSKTFIDELGKEDNSERKKKTDRINGFRKKARNFLDELKDKVRKPLDEWEAEQAKIKAEEEAAEKKKIQGRIESLFNVGVNMGYFDAASMSDDEFREIFGRADSEHEAKLARLAAEAKEKAEKEEAEEKAREEERVKLETERAELDKIKQEQADLRAKQQEEQERLIAEKKALADAKQAIQDTKDREALEIKLAAEAKVQAGEDAKEAAGKAAETERLEKEEAKRQEALRPIKDRIYDYADDILKEAPPVFKDESGNAIVQWAVSELKELSDKIKMRADDL